MLFDDALRHLLRIARIISQPRGNALLVGVGGSGKQSLTRLAAYMAQSRLFTISLTKTYSDASLLEDLRELYRVAGGSRTNVTFLFTYVCCVSYTRGCPRCVLTAGCVLLPLQRLGNQRRVVFGVHQLCAAYGGGVRFVRQRRNDGVVWRSPPAFPKVRVWASAVNTTLRFALDLCLRVVGIPRRNRPGLVETPDNLKRYLIDTVRDNLHVVLCMSPVNPRYVVVDDCLCVCVYLSLSLRLFPSSLCFCACVSVSLCVCACVCANLCLCLCSVCMCVCACVCVCARARVCRSVTHVHPPVPQVFGARPQVPWSHFRVHH